MPYLSLLWLSLGFSIMLIGVVLLAHLSGKKQDTTRYEDFVSYLMDEQTDEQVTQPSTTTSKQDLGQEECYEQIIELHKQNKSVEEIAKKTNRGVGEVKLIISLYTMR